MVLGLKPWFWACFGGSQGSTPKRGPFRPKSSISQKPEILTGFHIGLFSINRVFEVFFGFLGGSRENPGEPQKGVENRFSTLFWTPQNSSGPAPKRAPQATPKRPQNGLGASQTPKQEFKIYPSNLKHGFKAQSSSGFSKSSCSLKADLRNEPYKTAYKFVLKIRLSRPQNKDYFDCQKAIDFGLPGYFRQKKCIPYFQ